MRQIGDRSCRAIAKANPIKHHARTVDQRLIIEGRPEKPEGFTKPCLLSKDGVLKHREIHQHIADLEGTANATRDPLRHSKAVHNLATELDNTRIGRFRSVDLAHKSCFAGSVWANQRVYFAMLDIKRHIACCAQRPKGFLQAFKLQDQFVHCRPPLSCLTSPSSPPRANSTTAISIGPKMIIQFSA